MLTDKDYPEGKSTANYLDGMGLIEGGHSLLPHYMPQYKDLVLKWRPQHPEGVVIVSNTHAWVQGPLEPGHLVPDDDFEFKQVLPKHAYSGTALLTLKDNGGAELKLLSDTTFTHVRGGQRRTGDVKRTAGPFGKDEELELKFMAGNEEAAASSWPLRFTMKIHIDADAGTFSAA